MLATAPHADPRFKAHASEANKQLHEITTLIGELRGKVQAYLDAGHGASCRCGYCRWAPKCEAAWAVEDLEGAGWMLRLLEGALTTYTIGGAS